MTGVLSRLPGMYLVFRLACVRLALNGPRNDNGFASFCGFVSFRWFRFVGFVSMVSFHCFGF